MANDINQILANTFPTSSVEDSDLTNVNIKLVTQPLGSLYPSDIVGLIASRVKLVNQLPTSVTVDNGIGKFGLNIQHLVDAGYINNSVIEKINQANGPGLNSSTGLGIVPYKSTLDPNLTLTAINTPSSWTGYLGITTIDQLLSNETLQQQIFQAVTSQAYHNMISNQLAVAAESVDNLSFKLSVAVGLSFNVLTDFVNYSLQDPVVNNYAANAVQGSKKASSPGSAGIMQGISSASVGLDIADGLNLLNSGVGGLLDKLSSFSLSDLTSKPISISAGTFLSQLKPKIPTIAGTISQIPELNPNDPLAALNSALNSNPISSPVSGTTNRSTITSAIQNILIDPKDPNSSKLQIPTFAVPSAEDTKKIQDALNEGNNKLQDGLDELKKQLGISSINTSTGAAIDSIKTISNSLKG